LKDLQGRFLPRAQELALVQRREKLAARVVMKQEDVELVSREISQLSAASKDHPRVEVRMASDVGTFLPAADVRPLPHSSQYLPSPAPGTTGGVEVAVDPRDPSGAKPMQEQFEVVVTVDNPDNRYSPGQQAYVRFKLEKQPLLVHWARRFWQLIQTNSTGNNA
jgi:hypothetical protein